MPELLPGLELDTRQVVKNRMQRLQILDIDHVLAQTRAIWDEFRNRDIFITGGTGFFGCWLLESFAKANRQLDLRASVTVLTRDPAGFQNKAPHLARDPAIHLLAGDVRSFSYPDTKFSHVIHAATSVSREQIENSPLDMLETIVDGTRHVLDFARSHGVRKLLFTSSGAVYGRQPPGMSHIPEAFEGGPDPLSPSSVYGEGKRVAEQLCALTPGIECKIARCFAFIGPHLPLDAHFAAGNFIRDAIANQPIHVRGDGAPRRSYLYAADLCIWLWTILANAPAMRAYNVGSENSISILDLARETAAVLRPGLEIRVDQPHSEGAETPQYVPATARAQQELGLKQFVPLRDAIRRTAEWYVSRGGSRP